jgi:C-terminal peptidase prc
MALAMLTLPIPDARLAPGNRVGLAASLPDSGEKTMYAVDQRTVSSLILFHEAVKAVQENHYDPSSIDWNNLIRNANGSISSDADVVSHLNAALAHLDAYTMLFDAAAINKMRQANLFQFAGIGILFAIRAEGENVIVNDKGEPLPSTNADGFPIVETVLEGGAAEKAGIKPGDAICVVDGQSLTGLSIEAMKPILRGLADSEVSLEIKSKSGETRTVTATRLVVEEKLVVAKMLGDNKVGYINCLSFSPEDVGEQMRLGMEQLKNAEAIVLDLRSNEGGSVSLATEVLSLFIEDGLVAVVQKRIAGREIKREAIPFSIGSGNGQALPRHPYLLAHRPLVVLTSGNTASAAELATAALRDNIQAIVIGSKTFGKGIGTDGLSLPNDCILRVHTFRYFTPTGAWLGDGNDDCRGLEPDIPVERTNQSMPGSEADEQLNFSIALLQEKLALGIQIK